MFVARSLAYSDSGKLLVPGYSISTHASSSLSVTLSVTVSTVTVLLPTLSLHNHIHSLLNGCTKRVLAEDTNLRLNVVVPSFEPLVRLIVVSLILLPK